MEIPLMTLKVLLPYQVFAEIKNVSRIVAETNKGFYGFLPQRLDCVAALVPGIFTYMTEAEEIHYLAVDEGVLVKAGTQVTVSVSNAIEGTDLGKLHKSVQQEYLNIEESEKEIRSVMAKMESVFIKKIEKFHT